MTELTLILGLNCGRFHRRSLAMAQRRRTHVAARLMGVALVMVLVVLQVALGCNVDTRKPYIVFDSGDHSQPGSYFGYTVLQHQNVGGWWVLVGAPRGSSEFRPTAEKPGTLFRCNDIDFCVQVDTRDPRGINPGTLNQEGIVDHADNGWLGVSVTKQTNSEIGSGDVAVCAHRYGNNYAIDQPNADLSDYQTDRFIQGLCYTLNPELDYTETRYNPCAQEDAWRSGIVVNETTRWQGWCQFGISATYTAERSEDDTQTLVVGAPGSFDWTGTLFKATGNGAEMNHGDLNRWNEGYEYDGFNQYVGYSTTVGYFLSNTTQQGASGAPRAGGLVGKVYIYDLETFQVYQELKGEMMNTYFGGAVEALDVNNDGLYDLLVGAPLYSKDQDEGRVYVYMNRGAPNYLVLHQTIDGTSTPMSRFGQVITAINDINKDGFPDVAIGAPYEGGGVVYIFPCNENGIDEVFSQRIDGRDTDPTVVSFGSSISGGHDFDNNNYPDIVIGAYANDSVYVYKTRPLLDLLVNLIVTPDPMDPENPSCRDSIGTCLKIDVCFNYVGPSPGSLSKDIEVIYDLEMDGRLSADGFKPRFLLYNGTMVPKLHFVNTIYREQETCFNYTAYLQDTATDFLTPLPVDLTYILMDYEVEPPARGDAPQRFHQGLSPILKSYQCSAVTKTEEVMFVRDCGADAECETDIRLIASVEIEGDPTEIVVGGPSRAYLQVRVENVGEEAHQAEFTVTHPNDMNYEGLEIFPISCIDENGNDLAECTEKQTPVFCEAEAVNFVKCDLGNPMSSYTAITLRLRFDIGSLGYTPDRIIAIEMRVSTSSIEKPDDMADNSLDVQYNLVVEADTGLFGSVFPENVFYVSNSSGYADAAAAERSLEAAVAMAGRDPSSATFNDSVIGPPFRISYRLTNNGPGLLPFQSNLTINIPWRMLNGDWLVFIKSISVSDSTGQGSCNAADLIALQQQRLYEKYRETSEFAYAVEENIERIFDGIEGAQQLGCTKAKCVALRCYINQLYSQDIITVQIDAIQWEHTLITRKLGNVEILTEAKVAAVTKDGRHGQGEDENPDMIQLPIKMFTDIPGAGSVPIWVIILSILGGLLLLLLLILLLWKLGFFKRKTREDWENEIDGPAPPMPIKPTVGPNDNLEGSDLPMMKGPAAKD